MHTMMVTRRDASFISAVSVTVLFLAAVTPTLLVTIPAMEDYLDHLARMYILFTSGTPKANPYYQVSWALYSNLAIDIILPQLARFMDVETAGRVFILASQLLIFTGAIAIELSTKRRHELAGFAALLTLPSMPFALGLANFEFGTGVALWGIASWITLSQQHKWKMRFAVHALFVGIIYVSHFFALGIYGLTIGLLELRKLFRSDLYAKAKFGTLITLVSPVLVLLLLTKVTGARIGGGDNAWWLTWKPIWLALFLNGYSVRLAAGSAAALAILLSYIGLKHSISLSSRGKWIAVGFLLVFLAMPTRFFGVRMADIRMITAIFLIMPAFVSFSPKTKSLAYVAASIITAIVITNISYASYVWFSYQSDYAAMKASFALLRQGSFVLVGSNTAHQTRSALLTDAPMFRAPTLAVYYAKAFVSTLYTNPGTYAVEVRPDLKYLDINSKTESYALPSLATLQFIANGGKDPKAPMYIHNWTRNFDYVYLLGPPRPDILSKHLEKMFSSRRFTLYRVRK